MVDSNSQNLSVFYRAQNYENKNLIKNSNSFFIIILNIYNMLLKLYGNQLKFLF